MNVFCTNKASFPLRLAGTLAFLAAVTATSSLFSQEDSWDEVEKAEYGFRISFPGEPQYSTEHRDTGKGLTERHRYAWITETPGGRAEFIADCEVDPPEFWVGRTVDEEFGRHMQQYEESMRRLFPDIVFRKFDCTRTEVNGHPAFAYSRIMSTSGFNVLLLSQIVYVDNCSYSAELVLKYLPGSSEVLPVEVVERYFGSLSVPGSDDASITPVREAAAKHSVAGTWFLEDRFRQPAPMILKVNGKNVVGFWKNGTTTIEAVISEDGGTLNGTWEDADYGASVLTMRAPPLVKSGRITFTLSEDGQTLAGKYGYLDEEPHRTWNGSRTNTAGQPGSH